MVRKFPVLRQPQPLYKDLNEINISFHLESGETT